METLEYIPPEVEREAKIDELKKEVEAKLREKIFESSGTGQKFTLTNRSTGKSVEVSVIKRKDNESKYSDVAQHIWVMDPELNHGVVVDERSLFGAPEAAQIMEEAMKDLEIVDEETKRKIIERITTR